VHVLHALGAATLGAKLAPSEVPTAQGPGSSLRRDRALAKWDQVCEGDYFEVLGVPRDATSYEIRRAWERLRREFQPEACDPPLRDELGDKLREIAEVIDEAWRVLADDELRDSYRAHLPAPDPAPAAR
jgi:hypothetical protein